LLGYSDFPPVNALIGKLGKRISNRLNIANKSGLYWYEFVAPGELKGNSFTWKLNPNLGKVLEELGLLEEVDPRLYPEFVIRTKKDYKEGNKRKYSINIYERNSVARKKCIEYYGAKCSVCDIDFEKYYGKIGKGFIHVHHKKEISRIGKKNKVNPITDLEPVCPNCHSMIHRKVPAYTINELRSMINKTPNPRIEPT
jgi:5-methylcytosine-specific restriction protein A